jgi:1-deoxy-D-xylulose-5-phosphate synthase
MADGTGLNRFAEAHPDRFLDAGIAESCTVDMAAGMTKAGMRGVCAIYSTFLQRALDQIFQEVVLQGLPVIFCIDRAGLVGGDGAVHHGFMDIAYLRGMPRIVLMAPADEMELGQALDLALSLDAPCAIRYPRDNVPEPGYGPGPAFKLASSRTLRHGADGTILAYGSTVGAALDAADLLAADGLQVQVVNARFAKPVDADMVRDALLAGQPVVTVEDHGLEGGFGTAVLEKAAQLGLAANLLIRLGLPPDRFIQQGARAAQLSEAGIDALGIARVMAEAIRHGKPDDRARGTGSRLDADTQTCRA